MPDAQPSSVAGRSSVQDGLLASGVFFLALLLAYYQTTWSMIAIWLRSETFAHGFLILPISLWLVWNMRDRLRLMSARPAVWITFLMIPLGFGWLLAWLVDALVVQQLALVAMLVVGAWAIMGHRLALTLAFPLLFLFLAVPMGESLLVSPMMEFTAKSTVWLIQQTGVPVYREGMYFSLPSGNWSVVSACSGVRYIIASVTLGVLYAYLSYRSLWRRIGFVLVALIVPIFANTGRAYIIVMLGHWSDMTLATGVDHIVYGWVFFGLVMFLLFWLGSFFREDDVGPMAEKRQVPELPQEQSSTSAKRLAATLLALLLAGLWPWLAKNSDAFRESYTSGNISLPQAVGDWSDSDEPPWEWRPENRVAGQASAFYVRGLQTLGLFVQYPNGSETTGEEVVGSSTRFLPKHDTMRMLAWNPVSIQLKGEPVVVDQGLLDGVGEQLLFWSWYRVGREYTSNDYMAKFREVLGALGWAPAVSSRIVLVMPVQEDSVVTAQALMQDFLREHGDQLDEALDRALVGSH